MRNFIYLCAVLALVVGLAGSADAGQAQPGDPGTTYINPPGYSHDLISLVHTDPLWIHSLKRLAPSTMFQMWDESGEMWWYWYPETRDGIPGLWYHLPENSLWIVDQVILYTDTGGYEIWTDRGDGWVKEDEGIVSALYTGP